jgi:maleylpyruvate isomerase
MKLYHYWRSSSSWRVRWAMDYKKIPCSLVPISLLDGESESETHVARNPMGYVPVLETPQGFLTQSSAIVAWLEETHPKPSLFWGDSWNRARIRQLGAIITEDTQPVQNLPVLQLHSADTAEQKKWAQHFIRKGLGAFETLATQTAGKFSVGDELSWADLCLMPQLYNAARFEIAASEFPLLSQIGSECERLESYQSSHPSRTEPK